MIYTNEQNYIDIANAIRNLGGVGTFKPDEMAEAISGLGYNWDALAHRDFNGEANLTVNPRVYGLAGSNITKLTGSVGTLSNYLCNSCVNLATVNLPNATATGTYTFQGCTSLTSISMPEATAIGNYTCAGCSELVSADFSKATTIGTYCFQNCAKLTNLTLPNNVAGTIGTYAFAGCTALQNVSMPSVTAVGANAFQNCKGFTEINFPALKTLANSGFNGCSNVTSVNLPVATGGTKITYFLASCTKLTSVNMPALVSSGGHFFRYDTSLVNIALPKYTTVAQYDFGGCTSLEKVDILGKSTGCIAANSLNGATKFNTLIIRGNFVGALANISAFTNTPFASGKAGGTLYVPQDQIETYKTATNWTTLFGDSRAAGYANNQILSIEGSEYATKYADGTTIS